jgi:hypothetical protein
VQHENSGPFLTDIQQQQQQQSGKKKSLLHRWWPLVFVPLAGSIAFSFYYIQYRENESNPNEKFELIQERDTLSKKEASPIIDAEKLNNNESKIVPPQKSNVDKTQEKDKSKEVSDFSPPVSENVKNQNTALETRIKNEGSKKRAQETNKDMAMAEIDLDKSKEESVIRYKNIQIPSSVVSCTLRESVSSNRTQKGDEIYFYLDQAFTYDDNLILEKGAPVKARITNVRASQGGSRAALAFQIESVKAINGSWLTLSYPEYSDKKRGEIIFPKGLKLSKLKIKAQSITLEE